MSEVVNQSPPFFQAYKVGLVSASICTNLSIEEATDRLNVEHPTGIASRWVWNSEAKTFAGGEPHPTPCERDPESGRRHLLFHC